MVGFVQLILMARNTNDTKGIKLLSVVYSLYSGENRSYEKVGTESRGIIRVMTG